MQVYRVYCLDGADRFTRAEDIKAPTDEEAVRRASVAVGDALKYEIWERDRLVQRIERRPNKSF